MSRHQCGILEAADWNKRTNRKIKNVENGHRTRDMPWQLTVMRSRGKLWAETAVLLT